MYQTHNARYTARRRLYTLFESVGGYICVSAWLHGQFRAVRTKLCRQTSRIERDHKRACLYDHPRTFMCIFRIIS